MPQPARFFRRFTLLLSITLGALGVPAHAQDGFGPIESPQPQPTVAEITVTPQGLPTEPPTPTPTRPPASPTPSLTPTPAARIEGAIVAAEVAVAFPAGGVFAVIVGGPPETVAAASLRIGESDPVPVTVFQRRAGGRTAYVYRWEPAEPPPAFAPVAFRWQVTFTDGTTASAEESVVFADARVQWRTARSTAPDLTVAVPDGFGSAEAALNTVRAPVRVLAEWWPQAAPRGIAVFPPRSITPRCAEDSAARSIAIARGYAPPFACTNSAIAAAYAAGGWLSVEPGEGSLLRPVVTGALARAWGARSPDVPGWFREGVYRLFEPVAATAPLAAAQREVRAERVFSLETLAVRPQEASLQPAWDAQSSGMVAYLIDRVGLAGVFALARRAAEVPFAQAYTEVTGGDPRALIIDWSAWIFTNRAAAAYAVSPYNPATPVPTATHTPEPTRTPTATEPPPTLAPTRPVVPTLNVTRTPTPLPPTVTPRPPGSLRTATPPAAPAAGAQNGGVLAAFTQVSPLGILAVLLTVLLVLLLALAAISRQDTR
jgi:hypothetical protein